MYCNDVPGIAWRLFDLLSQFCDVHIDCASERETAVAPNRIEKLVARDNLAAVLNEEPEDIELARRHLQRDASLCHLELLEIDGHISEAEIISSFRLTVRAAEQRFDASHQFHKAEWFGDIIVRSYLQSDDFVNFLTASRRA